MDTVLKESTKRISIQLKSWGGKISYSIMDQALFSGANFLTNILLVRWLVPKEYGSFSVSFTVFLVISGIYSALVLEPFSVLGSNKYWSSLQTYTKVNALFHLVFMGAVTVIGLTFLYLTRVIDLSLKIALIGMFVSSSPMLFYWFFRQSCYIRTQPTRAFYGSLLYSILLFISLITIRYFGQISPATAFYFMGISSFFASVIFWPDKRSIRGTVLPNSNLIKKTINDQWVYGKWALGTSIAYSLSSNVYLIFVALYLGLSQAGILRATQNLILPLQQIIAASNILILPLLVRERSRSSKKSFINKSTVLSLIYFIGSLVYVLFLILFRKVILHIFYNSDIYDKYLWMIIGWGVILLLVSLISSITISLRAMERPKYVFIAYLVSSAFTITLGARIILNFQLPGVMVSMTLSYLLSTLAMGILFYWKH